MRRQLRRVQQALDRAVDDQVGRRQRGDDAPGCPAIACEAPVERIGTACVRRRGGHDDVEDAAAERLRGEACRRRRVPAGSAIR